MLTIDLFSGLGVAVGFFAGISIHDYAHSVVAIALGDRTPRLTRRRTLDLRAHVDPLGTLVMPAIFTVAATVGAPILPMFGWGKRHALNPRALRNPRRDVVIVALAGPGALLVLAVVARSVAEFVGCGATGTILSRAALVLLFVAVIEILPIPGRDGGRVLARFLSPHAAAKMDELLQYEVLFLLGLFLFLGTVVNRLVAQVASFVGGLSC